MINSQVLRYVAESFSYIGQKKIKEMACLEIGNQLFSKHKETIKMLKKLGFPALEHGYQFFNGVFKTSTRIDFNGLSYSLKIDLTEKNNNKSLIDKFDYIIDIGCAEHMMNQYNYFYNLHNFCKVGGYILSIVPKKNHWQNHGYFKYTPEFFRSLFSRIGYEEIYVENVLNEFKKNMHDYIRSFFVKKEKLDFLRNESFSKLPGLFTQGEPLPKSKKQYLASLVKGE